MWAFLLSVIETVGLWPYGSFSSVALDTSETHMFLSSGAGVWVMKNDSGSWNRIGEIRLVGDGVQDLWLDEASRKLYVLSSTFQVWDVADPRSPVLLGHTELPRSGLRMDVKGNIAFVALREFGMQAVDVTDPSAPQVVGTYAPDQVWDVDVQDSLAVLLVGSYLPHNTLHLVNVSNPAQPTLLGTWTCSGWGSDGITDFALRDTFLLVLADETLYVLSVASPSSPVLLNGVPLSYATHLTLTGNLAYAVGGVVSWWEAWSGIWVLDLSSLPVVVVADSALNEFPILPHRIAGAGGRAYVVERDPLDEGYLGGGERDLVILEGTQPVGFLASPGGGVLDAIPYGTKGFLSSSGEGILLMDFSDPGWPVMVRRWFNIYRGRLVDLSIHGNWLFAVSKQFDWDRGFTSSLVAKDIRDSVAGYGWGFDPYPHSLQGYTLHGDSLYVILRGDSLLIFEVRNVPPFPLRAQTTLPFPGRRIAVQDTLAAVTAGTTGVGILSLSDPENPQLLGVIHTGGEAKIPVFLDRVLYVADGSGGLQVYSLARPDLPVKVAHLPVEADGLELAPPYGVVWSFEGTLHLLDITDPVHPAILDSYVSDGALLRVRLEAPYLFLSMGGRGLAILRFSPTGIVEAPPRALLLRRGDPVPSLKMLDLLGRPVRLSPFLPPGTYFLLNGQGERKRAVTRLQILP